MSPDSFLNFTIGNVATVVGVLIAYVKLRNDQRKSHDQNLKEQTKMHLENQYKLDRLAEFHESQLELNRLRDRQIHELEKQTAILGEISKGLKEQMGRLWGTKGK